MTDGVFPFLKPPGITSHDAVGIVRRILKEKRVGHAGTLDPSACGVLPIFVGRATRLVEYATDLPKTYIAEAMFGMSTDTEDITGNVIAQSDISDATDVPDVGSMQSVLHSFVGTIEQRPSKFSALKVNGRRAYELAREGVDFELPARAVRIRGIRLKAWAFPYMTVEVSCSSGTYIRALLRDIFESIGASGTMTHLVRSAVGPYAIEGAITGEELQQIGAAALQPPDSILAHLDVIRFTEAETKMLIEGKRPANAACRPDGLYRSYGPHGFIGLVQVNGTDIKVEKNIYLP